MKFGSVLMSASAICVFGMCLHNHDAVADDGVTVNCDPSVERGMIIMSDPPTVNCKDLKFFSMFVGTGLEFGPITDMDDLEQQLTELPSPPVKVTEGVENNSPPKTTFEIRRDLAYQELDDFNAAERDEKHALNMLALRSPAPGYEYDGDVVDTDDAFPDIFLLGKDVRPQVTFEELADLERMRIIYGYDKDGHITTDRYCSGGTHTC